MDSFPVALILLALLATPLLWAAYQHFPLHPYYLTRRFHRAFGHPVAPHPIVPDAKMRLLRVKLIGEEFAEFARASGFPVKILLDWDRHTSMLLRDAEPTLSDDRFIDSIEAADGLADLNVVVNGSALVWGFPQPLLDRAVYRSNMSKLGADGKPIYAPDGKIMKGPNYTPPTVEITRLLVEAEKVSQLQRKAKE